MITVTDLVKTFHLSKKQRRQNNDNQALKYAVNGVSFTVNDNEIFGILGPNGAGKTTILRCLSTLIRPTSGRICYDGKDIAKHAAITRKNLAFLTSELKLDEHFSAQYTMQFFGALHEMTASEIAARSAALFKLFGIESFRETKIKHLSTGMKQKLSIAVSLIHDPAVIIFDEPTNGLDIITAKTVTDYLLSLKAQGKTIIVSSHHMHVIEKLCDRMIILLNGKIHAEGTRDQITHALAKDSLENAFFELYYKEVSHA